MQSKEKVLELQNVFSKKHVGLMIVLLVFMAVSLIMKSETDPFTYAASGIAVGVILLDVVFSYFQYFHKFSALVFVRFVEMLCTGGMVSDTLGFSSLLALVFYMIFTLETVYLFDMSEFIGRIRLSLLSPFGILIKGIIDVSKSGDDYAFHLMNYGFLLLIIGLIIFAISSYYGNIQNFYDATFFAKDRMLDKAKDNTDKINESQKSLMIANEQLGIKKFELEEAYKQINRANADIEMQNKCLSAIMSDFDLNVINEKARRIFDEHFDLVYAGVVFKNERLRKKYSGDLYNVFSDEEIEQICDYFLSYAFIHEHRQMGSNYVNNIVSFDEYPFFERTKVASIAIKTFETDDKEQTSIYMICCRNAGVFENKEIMLDNIFASMQMAANNLSMYYKIQDMSIRDALSGLYNRRYLNEYVSSNFIEKQFDGKVGIAMCDIDHFKSINDTYGHLFGDQAIKMVASVIKKIANANGGLAFRYGGEEFVVVFEGKDLAQVVEIMEQIRKKIRETEVKSPEFTINVRVSVGVTAYPEKCANVVETIDRADKAMYYSKQHGRDRLTVDGEYKED